MAKAPMYDLLSMSSLSKPRLNFVSRRLFQRFNDATLLRFCLHMAAWSSTASCTRNAGGAFQPAVAGCRNDPSSTVAISLPAVKRSRKNRLRTIDL